MRLSSVRELKQSLHASLGRRLGRGPSAPERIRGIALGIAAGRNGRDFRLAVRAVAGVRGVATAVEKLRLASRGEIDVRIGGRDVWYRKPWYQRRTRPLLIGSSIGLEIRDNWWATGTLGAFVTDADGDTCILSNSHVLLPGGNERLEDRLAQPSGQDQTAASLHRVADVTDGTVLSSSEVVLADAGIARLHRLRRFDAATLTGIRQGGRDGQLRAPGAPPTLGETVFKIGRSTGVTSGAVTVIELDGREVADGEGGVSTYDDVFMVLGEVPFSSPGDSGSMIVGSDCRAIGLLFGGDPEEGTSSGQPIGNALDALGVTLLT